MGNSRGDQPPLTGARTTTHVRRGARSYQTTSDEEHGMTRVFGTRTVDAGRRVASITPACTTVITMTTRDDRAINEYHGVRYTSCVLRYFLGT